MKTKNVKYVFTQLSAVFAFYATPATVVLSIKKLVGAERFSEWYSLCDSSFWYAIIVGISFFLIPGLTGMFLWGRLLVLIGMLTKKEAKGYPFSDPRESEDDL